MLRFLLALLALVLAIQSFRETKKPGESVDTKSGTVKGIVSLSRDGREFYEWRGIPYAEPPLGPLRFASPKPVKPWTGTKDTSEYGSKCIQVDAILRESTGIEDCLFLNVFIPKVKFHQAKETKKLLPVMVWIHGGLFHLGHGDMTTPEYFMDEDVVVVTLNYRLGIFGFLSTQDGNVRGNMGLKDQALALRWVKENIETFGGNPDQITIFGESAGGSSVHFQMLYAGNKDIISRAISQSGTVLNPWAFTKDPIGPAKHFAQDIGCSSKSNEEMVDCFRRIDADDLIKGHLSTLNVEAKKIRYFGPVVEAVNDEEAFLTQDPRELYAQGNVLAVPWLTGVTADEGVLYTVGTYKNSTFHDRIKNDWNVIENSWLMLTPEEKKQEKEIREYYLGDKKTFDVTNDPSVEQGIIKMTSDYNFFNPCFESMQLHSKLAPVYPYIYDLEGPSLAEVVAAIEGNHHPVIELAWSYMKTAWNYYVHNTAKKDFGKCHGDDLAMQFQMPMLFSVPRRSPYYENSKAFVKSWVLFAQGNRPVFKDVKFPEVTKEGNEKFIYLSDHPQIVDYPYRERYEFWKNIAKNQAR